MSDLSPEALAEWRKEANGHGRVAVLIDALAAEKARAEQAERERDFLLRWGEDMEAQRDEETAALSDLRAAVKALADAQDVTARMVEERDLLDNRHRATVHRQIAADLRRLAETDADNDCSTCGGTRLVDWAPGEHRDSEEDQQPCPDCPTDADNGGGEGQ